MKVKAILPRRSIRTEELRAGVQREMRAFARDFQREMSEYPPPRPWQGRTPKTGPRADGQRTGRYGLGWQSEPILTPLTVTIVNRVPYARYVGGPHGVQRDYLAARGWNSIDDIGPDVADRRIPALVQLILPR